MKDALQNKSVIQKLKRKEFMETLAVRKSLGG